MTRIVRKEIYSGSVFRNTFCKNRTEENEKLYQKQRNKYFARTRKYIKECFHNITDNNIVTNKTIEILTNILESETEIAINWFKDNHMIANPGRFQVVIFNRHKINHTNVRILTYIGQSKNYRGIKS